MHTIQSLLELPSAAILIDCLETAPKSGLREVYNDIINFLDSTPQIQVVVLATYKNSDLMSAKTRPYIWYENYFKSEKMRTDSMILNYKNRKKYQVAFNEIIDLQQLLADYTQIKNIYFMGTAWSKCIQSRPLGIESVSRQFPDINILVNENCVYENFETPRPKVSEKNEFLRINDTSIFIKMPIRNGHLFQLN